MGKKRKAGGKPFGKEEPRRESKEDSKLRINTYEDVADSEDEFHINRDKILLDEGPAQKRQRQLEEEGIASQLRTYTMKTLLSNGTDALLEPSDEEVLAASDAISESEGDSEDDEELPEPTRKRVKLSTPGKRPQDSDSDLSAASEVDEDAGGWGTSRKDYYDADKIETEADALEEEAEVKRLQQRQLQGMTEADFGFDETDWLEAGKDAENEDEDDEGRGRVVREVLPKPEITDAMGPEERLKILRIRYPEFEPLAKEFLSLQTTYDDLKDAAAEATAIQLQAPTKADGPPDTRDPESPVAVVKYSALSAYLASLSMYFALFTSGKAGSDGKLAAMPPEQLRDHSIMETLVQCRNLWERIKNVALPEIVTPAAEEPLLMNGHDSVAVVINNVHPEIEEHSKPRKHKKSKAQKATEAAQAEADARRAERLRQTESELASLSALTKIKPSKPTQPATKSPENSDSDFGEQTSLTAHEAAEKAKRKKSLKFYTSQIAQKANKRDAGGRDAGGDADIPYRERLKDRQARLTTEAEKRGKNPKESQNGAPLGISSDEEDHTTARELRADNEHPSKEEEDYYSLIASRAASKKASKAALAAAHAQADKEGGIVRIVEEEGGEGKRGITYAIEKNKGLAPKRKKE
ncbi:U3 small nucleolar RNA-associated protein 3, partial [Lecanoromycetidae sp. Uapishka_2]